MNLTTADNGYMFYFERHILCALCSLIIDFVTSAALFTTASGAHGVSRHYSAQVMSQ